MTKPIVSVAAMMMIEEGRLKLTDPVSAYLPELKDLKVAKVLDAAQMLKKLSEIPLLFQPGTTNTSRLDDACPSSLFRMVLHSERRPCPASWGN